MEHDLLGAAEALLACFVAGHIAGSAAGRGSKVALGLVVRAAVAPQFGADEQPLPVVGSVVQVVAGVWPGVSHMLL